MRLSEAIRLGAMSTPKASGRYAVEVWEEYSYGVRRLATCALGAASYAAGFDENGRLARGTFLAARWPWVWTTKAPPCPVCQRVLSYKTYETPARLSIVEKRSSVSALVVHLNDDHDWPRERIADLVATLPDDQQPMVPEATPEVVLAHESCSEGEEAVARAHSQAGRNIHR